MSGFTLVEAAVSLAILALALGAIYQSFAWSLTRTAVLNERQIGILTATSVLAELVSSSTLTVGEMHGRLSGMDWTARIVQKESSGSRVHAFPIYEITVRVDLGDPHRSAVELRSVKVGWPIHA